MKLRNKITGEIRELPDGFFCGDNLKKICEEWEDYDEPKKHYFITDYGKVFELNEIDKNLPDTDIRNINCVESYPSVAKDLDLLFGGEE